MKGYVSVVILILEIVASTSVLGQFDQFEPVVDVRCSLNQYIEGNECVACPANATCNGKTATCKRNMVTITQDGKVECRKVPIATVQNGKVKKQCREESHMSIDWIRNRYKNCSKCGVINVGAGKCPNNRKPHRHYYCDCAC